MPILLCGLVLGALVFALSALRENEYKASATLLLRSPDAAEALFGSGSPPTAVSIEREAATTQKLLELSALGPAAAPAVAGLSPRTVAGMVSVERGAALDLASVAATSHDPAQAREVANAFARRLVSLRANHDRKRLVVAQRRVEARYEVLSHHQRNGVLGRELQGSAAQLAALSSLQTGGVEILVPATLPSSPTSPKPLRDGLLAAALGLLLGLAGAFAFERFGRRRHGGEAESSPA